MGIREVHKWEKAVVMLLNLDGWDLKWSGKVPVPISMYCPDTTMWTKKRVLKPVYLLKESQAARVNLNKN